MSERTHKVRWIKKREGTVWFNKQKGDCLVLRLLKFDKAGVSLILCNWHEARNTQGILVFQITGESGRYGTEYVGYRLHLLDYKKRSLTQFVILLCSKLLLIICPGKGWHSTFSKHLINSGVFGFTLRYPWKTCMSSLPVISLSKLGSWCTVYGYMSDIRLTVILQDTRVCDFLENNSKYTSPTLKSVR